MTRVWSPMQQDVFAHIQRADQNLMIRAVAGSGKTTTIVEGMKHCQGSRVFLAFNKSIADELKARGVNARTFHSMTYSPVATFKGSKEVDTLKMRRLFKKIAPNAWEDGQYMGFTCRLVGLGKQMGLGCLLPNTLDEWIKIVNHHALELEKDGGDIGRALELAELLLDASNEDYGFDFDDMLYTAVKEDLTLAKFDWVFVDEAQDTNAIQRALLKKIMHPNSRLVAVGDPSQAIYGFRGADSHSMQTMADMFNCTPLPLTVSYRCAKSVVKYVNQWVPDMLPHDDAPEGEVQALNKWTLDMFKPGDLVVCRMTKNVVSLGFKLIRAQIPAQIMGREIGEGLRSLIKKMGTSNLDELSERIAAWRDREMEKALKNDDAAKADNLSDKAEAILTIVDGMPENMRTLDQVFGVLDYLFAPGNPNAVKLSTIHKAKGLEADTVYWLNRSACPAKWAKQDWQKEQELNLCYVAGSRAISKLVLIEDDGVRASKHTGVDEN